MIGQKLPSPRRVVVWLPPGGQLVGVIGLFEVLDAANRVLADSGRPPLYSLQLAGVGDRAASVAGPVLCTAPMSTIRQAHTVVIGGGLQQADVPYSESLVGEVARVIEGAERVVSVCMGAFVLGELGLLDGRRCTCHWLALDRLRDRYPAAKVQDDAIFTEDGHLFTSAGATAGIDLALHLVRLDGGRRLAVAVARVLVVFAQRPGGQSQFGSSLRLRPGLDDRMHRLVGRIQHNPGGDLCVHALARSVGLSPRHFARVFRDQTGQTPAAFVACARVEAAQRALVYSDAGLATIAEDCGFGGERTLRRTFLRVAGVTPSAYRDRFQL